METTHLAEMRNETSMNASIVRMEANYTHSKLYPWVVTPPALVFFAICICANLLILLFVMFSRTYKSPANYLLANLCLSSILFILNQIVYNFEKSYPLFTYGPWICVIDSYLHRIPLPLMTLTIMSLSVDRCRIARNPLNMPSRREASLQIVAVWVVSLLIAVPRGLGSEFVVNTKHVFRCKMIPFLNSPTAQATFATINLFIIYILPAIFLIKELKKTRSQMQYLTSCQMEQGKSFIRRLRLMRNACIFTLIFLTCWLPLGLMQFPLDWLQPRRPTYTDWLVAARDVFGHAVLIQACVNPILLQILSFDFQEVLTHCWCSLI